MKYFPLVQAGIALTGVFVSYMAYSNTEKVLDMNTAAARPRIDIVEESLIDLDGKLHLIVAFENAGTHPASQFRMPMRAYNEKYEERFADHAETNNLINPGKTSRMIRIPVANTDDFRHIVVCPTYQDLKGNRFSDQYFFSQQASNGNRPVYGSMEQADIEKVKAKLKCD